MGLTCRASYVDLLALAVLGLTGCGGGSDTAAPAAVTVGETTTTSAPVRRTTTAPAAARSTTAPVTATGSTAARSVVTTSTPPSTSASTSTTTTLLATPAGPDLKIDQIVDWMHFESVKCAGPIGTWPIVVSGTRDIGSGVRFLLAGTGEATLAGPPTAASGQFAADWMINVEGIPLSTGGQNAHIEGTAEFVAGTLTLQGQTSGTSHGENPYAAVVMAMMSSVERITLTPVAGSFC